LTSSSRKPEHRFRELGQPQHGCRQRDQPGRCALRLGHHGPGHFGLRKHGRPRKPAFSDRSKYSVVPESPNVGSRVPHQLSPRRPRRWRRLRRRPRRRRPPGSPPGRTKRASRTLPVVAVIPVPVRDVVPTRVPWITRAPVIAGRRGWSRPGRGAGAAGQSESGQNQPATHQHARRPPNPRCRLLYGRHLPRISLRPESRQVVIPAEAEHDHVAFRVQPR
jgi:hypothetical protein